MVNRRQEHLEQPLQQLRSLSRQVNTDLLSFDEVAKATTTLKKLLEHPTCSQVMRLFEKQKNESRNRLEKLERNALDYLESVEVHITPKIVNPEQYNNATNSNLLTPSETSPHHLYLKLDQVSLRVAMYFHSRSDKQDTLNLWFFSKKEYLVGANNFLRKNSPSFTAWEKEHQDYTEQCEILRTVASLQSSNQKIDDHQTSDTGVIEIQKICRLFEQKLIYAAGLAFTTIKGIKFVYVPESKKKIGHLKLYVNNNVDTFSGKTAVILKKLLEHPYDQFEVEDFREENNETNKPYCANKKSYDKFYTKIKAINKRMALSNQYATYGLFNFIIIEKYSVWLNPDYADLIK
jgi:hypothetical protein